MPLKPKHQLGARRPSAARQFTDREEFITILDRALADKQAKPQEHRVLVFYGVGGIGKTRLRKEFVLRLQRQHPELLTAALDLAMPQYHDVSNALAVLRQSLSRDYGVAFRTFDIAYAAWWKKANPTMAMQVSSIPFIEEGSLAALVLATVAQLPVVGWIPAIARLAVKGERAAAEWWTKRGQQELAELPEMESSDIIERLPSFWAADVKEHLQRKENGAVLFLDTFEALTGGERAEGRVHATDEWVRELVTHLPEALWVICGREKLRWAETDADWQECLDSHLVGGLASTDSEQFLVSCGIADQTVRQAIVTGSEGVPFYLDLAIDTHDEILAADSEPKPQDFASSPHELFVRFLRHLNDAEVETLKVLAVPRFWDRALFGTLVEEYKTGYPLTAFDRLCRFSFVSEPSPTGTWTMHQLMRDSLQKHADKELVARVHHLLFDYYAGQLKEIDIKNITPAQKTALPEAFFHARSILPAKDLYQWLKQPAEQFKQAAQWRLLEPLYEQASHDLETELGPEHPAVAESLNGLACSLYVQGRYAEAEPLYKRALAIREKVLGPGHPSVAESLDNLAGLLQSQGKYAEVEPLHKRALAIREKALGPEHPDVAQSLSNLAGLLQTQGKYAEAEALYRRALAIREKALGPDHPDVAGTLNNLATSLDSLGRYAEAEPLYKRALEIWEKTFGPEHPDVASVLHALAQLYKDTGRYAEVEPLLKRALEIRQKSLPVDHADIASTLNDLAQQYEATGRYAEAEPLKKRVLEMIEAKLGKDHPTTASAMGNLATLYRNTGRYAEAEPMFKRALEIYEAKLGKDHPTTGGALNNLAVLYRDTGRYAEAEPLFKRAQVIREDALGSEHPAVASCLNNLALLYQATGRYAEAEPLYRRALVIREKVLGPKHPLVAKVLENLVALCRATGRDDEAKELEQRVAAIRAG
jgi:tetratricopeptide (TPR) repeat protein